MSQLKTPLYSLFLIALVGALGYISWIIYKNETLKEDRASALPLFELTDFNLIRYDVQGKRIYTLRGPYMKHFDDEKGSVLTQPFLTHYFNKVSPETGLLVDSTMDWTAQSLEGLISSDSNLITMNENVILNKKDLTNDQITTLKTSQLFIHDKGEKATSEKFVTILSPPNNVLEGTGLEGFPNIGQFKLLNNIESYYETKK